MSPSVAGLAFSVAAYASVRGRQPASRAMMMTEVPSTTNKPVSRRTFRIWSERMNFTCSFCRLVITRGANPRRSVGEVIGAPAREQ
jgi:hypothetical protein